MPHNFGTNKEDDEVIKIIRIELAILCNHVYNDNKGLIFINPRWPSCDLLIITLCIVTFERMITETCVLFLIYLSRYYLYRYYFKYLTNFPISYLGHACPK